MNREQDISLQKYAHLLLEHAPVGMALFDSRELCLLAANARYHVLHQSVWQQASIIGQVLTSIVPYTECDRLVTLFRAVIETGVVYHNEAYAVSVPGHETHYWNWTLDPIYEYNRVRYVLMTLCDVTSQVAALKAAEQAREELLRAHREAEVKQQHLYLYTILDQLPEGVLLVESVSSNVIYVNPAAASLLGFALPQLLGVPLHRSALMSPHHLTKRDQKIALRWNFALINALWGKTTPNQEYSIIRPDGSEIIVLSSAAPIRSANKMITEAVIVFQDITASKRLEEQKNEFFAIANHELRTPLTIIAGFAEILPQLAQDTNSARFKNAVASIEQEGNHLMQLIDELLDVSRLEQTHMTMQKSYQDFLTPLRQLIDTYKCTSSKHQLYLMLEEELGTEPLLGWFDMPRIEQIFHNLLTNAVKYSPDGGNIEVGVSVRRDAAGKPQEVLFWVTDGGIGIAEEDLPHIFERFYRVEKLEWSIGGFGIGLYLTKELVKSHGGHIRVESRKGEGSTFFVTLPLGDAHHVIS
jgi:PAS domain S-box-containing protein